MAAARQALASMLDELMGKHRNALPSEQPVDVGFEDPDVCKYFLAGYCHHELFTNTKADLGQCGKVHDEKLRDEYRASEKFEKLGYEDEWLAALQRVHNDMQRKIMRNKQRLDVTQPGGSVENANKDKVQTKIDSLSEKITAVLQQAETLGSQGRVEDAQKLIEKTEEMKEERDHCRKTVDTPVGDLKQMEVCDTCGCFLIVGDSQHRIDEHLMGKQHLGFAKIKATIDELMRKKEERRRQKEDEYRKEIQEREKRKRGNDEYTHHRHHRQHRSRSRSPDSRHSRGHYYQRGSADRRRVDDYRRRGDSAGRRFPDKGEEHRRNSSSSRHSSHARHSSHHRDRSSVSSVGRSRSPCDINGKSRRNETDCDRKPVACSADDGHKVNMSSPNTVLMTASSSDRPGGSHEDEEDEEGLIKSSDE